MNGDNNAASTPNPPSDQLGNQGAPVAITLRPAQRRILEYTGGPMGVSAVPGAGKTFTLSLLAAYLVERILAEDRLGARSDDREVLVVTFTNSAVGNFRARIGAFLRSHGLLAGVGYRVRTLHGLAHDIVRERPGLVGLSEDFDIVDERTASEVKREAAINYLRSNPDALAPYIKPENLQQAQRIERYLIEDAIEIATNFIRVAKELPVQAHELAQQLAQQSGTWPLLDFGVRIYADYQRSLALRGAVDFDDLILLALQALEADEGYLIRLRDRWPYVLEDEAQDSSSAQEHMLRLLTGSTGNWVRVGDPNQAINTTFTSANTRFLQRFLQQYAEQARDLPNSGRSARPIIDVANFLIGWSRAAHPLLPEELALTRPEIEPTPPDDPQPNPPPGTPAVYVHTVALSPDKEIEMVVRSLQRWLPQNGDRTTAVLVPENVRGFSLTEALERAGLPYDDSLLRTDSTTRASAHALATVLKFVANPQAPGVLEPVWSEVWYPRWAQQHGDVPGVLVPPGSATTHNPFGGRMRKVPLPEPVQTFADSLAKLREVELFVFPERLDWLDGLHWLDDVDGLRDVVAEFRTTLQRWARAVIQPVDELLLTLGNDLFTEPGDLALSHRLAVLLAKLADENPTWRLPELAGELENIALNKRRILGFGEDAQGYEAQKGYVTVATMHAAKGLEWDRVYLTGLNSFGFPGGGEADSYRSERWYVRDRLNLVAETEAQLRQLHMGTLDDYRPGEATLAARLDLAAERLRLLYVGITRARRELILTYNTGRNFEKQPLEPAVALQALAAYVARTQPQQPAGA
jgi:DNA helicase-2/ATP-dependent DNA helicase PcrA